MVYELNGKKIRIPEEDIKRLVKTMDIDEEEAIEIWLEDEGYLENEEQEALCKAAKDNKILASLHRSADSGKERKKREVTRKENPTKEKIIAELAKFLPQIGAEDLVIENIGKLITFKMDGNEYKLDLVQKRPPKKGV